MTMRTLIERFEGIMEARSANVAIRQIAELSMEIRAIPRVRSNEIALEDRNTAEDVYRNARRIADRVFSGLLDVGNDELAHEIEDIATDMDAAYKAFESAWMRVRKAGTTASDPSAVVESYERLRGQVDRLKKAIGGIG
jgi:hypothetical protein